MSISRALLPVLVVPKFRLLKTIKVFYQRLQKLLVINKKGNCYFKKENIFVLFSFEGIFEYFEQYFVLSLGIVALKLVSHTMKYSSL